MGCYFMVMKHNKRVVEISQEKIDQHQDHTCDKCLHTDDDADDKNSPCFNCGPFADDNEVKGVCNWKELKDGR